jgi:polyisoprenoid-binding protein YceI
MTSETKTKWIVDPKHSEVQFKVKHLAISNVSGTFKIFQGEVESEGDDFNNASIHFEMESDSIDTNLQGRDGFLKSENFLDVQKFPKLIFDGNLLRKEDNYHLEGELTIRETKKSIKMEVEHTGTGMGRFGDYRAGFELNGKISRKDFGLVFNLATEAGNLIMGEEIKLHCDIEIIRQGEQL